MTTLPIENIPCVTLLVISVITLQSTTRRFDPFIVVTLAIIAFAHFFMYTLIRTISRELTQS